MQRIIFATTNENKMKEIREILSDFPVEIFSLKEAGIKADIDENGSSFEENAAIKAEAIEKMTGAIVLADDSGLEIDYLNGEPGIYSARYMGEETSYHVKNAHLIERLKGVPDEQRTARFVCCVAAAFPDRETAVVRGTIEGRIGYKEEGENGFGYDPLFFVTEKGKGMAEMTLEEKNEISHRSRAFTAMKAALNSLLSDTP